MQATLPFASQVQPLELEEEELEVVLVLVPQIRRLGLHKVVLGIQQVGAPPKQAGAKSDLLHEAVCPCGQIFPSVHSKHS